MARLSLTTIASMTSTLDRIAEELESIDPKLALALDRVSDRIDVLSDTHTDIEKEVFNLAESGDISILKDPKYKKYLEIKDEHGRTPIHWLAWKGKPGILKPEFKEILKIQDEDGDTPLHLLAFDYETGILILKPEYKEILKIQDEKGWTPLHVLASMRGGGKTEILKPEYKDILKIQDKLGETPLHGLADLSKTEILKPEYKEILKIQDYYDGYTPLHLLAKEGKTEILNPEYKEILKIQDKKGRTPVDLLEYNSRRKY